jgi:hypothetical protein
MVAIRIEITPLESPIAASHRGARIQRRAWGSSTSATPVNPTTTPSVLTVV